MKALRMTATAPGAMPCCIFGRTNLEVSRLGFGAAPIGFLESDQREVDAIVDQLIDAGVNLFDTACSYEGSEEALGRALRDKRDKVVLLTKIGSSTDVPGEQWTPEHLLATADRSLRRLRTDHLDVMLLHTCSLNVLRKGEAVGALLRLQQQGKVRHIGYSGDNDEAAYAVQLGPLEVLETSVNVCDQHNIDTVLPLARRYNVAVIAKRPIANAAWRQADEQRGMYKDYAAPYAQRLAKMNVSPQRLGFDDHVEITWPDVALRFTLSIDGVHTAIVGTTNPNNAVLNLAAAKRGPLPEEAVNHLRKAFTDAQNNANEPWPGLS